MSKRAASALPDDMVAGGLADDFDGVIREARYVEWDYDGTKDLSLFLRLKIERQEKGLLEDEKVVLQHYSAGALSFFRPSLDGEGNQLVAEGYFAWPVGDKEKLVNTTNQAQFMRSVVEAGFPKAKFAADIRFLENVKGHFNRLPPDKKPGVIKNQTEEERKKAEGRTILCITRFDGFEGNASPSSGATATSSAPATSSPSTASASNGSGDLDARIIEVLKAKVAVDSTTKKTALAGIVVNELKNDKAIVGKATKRVVENDFLDNIAGEGFTYDAAAGTVSRLF